MEDMNARDSLVIERDVRSMSSFSTQYSVIPSAVEGSLLWQTAVVT